jgi:hypothetical protein
MDLSPSAKASLNNALLVLQSPSATPSERVVALRFLQAFAKNGTTKISASSRHHINELVLQNVLQIVMSEDRVTDLRKRQLIRTECFLTLVGLLESDTLFGDVRDRLNEMQEVQMRLISGASDLPPPMVPSSSASVGSSSTTSSTSFAPIRTMPSRQASVRSMTQAQQAAHGGSRVPHNMQPHSQHHHQHLHHSHSERHLSGEVPHIELSTSSDGMDAKLILRESYSADGHERKAVLVALSSPDRPKPGQAPPGGWVRSTSASVSSPPPPGSSALMMLAASKSVDGSLQSLQEAPSSPFPFPPTYNQQLVSTKSYSASGMAEKSMSKSLSDLSLLKPAVMKPPRQHIQKKYLKSRPSMFLSDEYEPDGFVPGVDPTNWFEQDRKLGYQKSRMWFPAPGFGVGNKMVPGDRGQGKKAFGPDRVVEEFMQMKALLSYVGDLVVPHQRIPGSVAGPSAGDMKPLKQRMSGVVDHKRYSEAIQQAVQMWTPLMGAHLPPAWTPKQYEGSASKDASHNAYLESSSQASSSAAPPLPPRDAPQIPPKEFEQSVIFTKGVLRRLLKKEIQHQKQSSKTLRQ